jgi:transcriptional regulator with XRE-family HTH domain
VEETLMNMELIGRYIAGLRKQKDLTPVELAKLLNLPHPTVSKWERGESMPDMATLPQLAALLDTRVHDLLEGGKRSYAYPGTAVVEQLVEKLNNNQPEQVALMINEQKASLADLLPLLPILKASMLRKILEHVESTRFTLAETLKLAPFLLEDSIELIISQVLAGKLDWHYITGLAPYIEEDLFDRIVDAQLADGGDVTRLPALAPYLTAPKRNAIAERIVADGRDKNLLIPLAPFLADPVLAQLISSLLKGV